MVDYVRAHCPTAIYSLLNDHPLNYARLREMQMSTVMNRETTEMLGIVRIP